ncbi:hypothetical protein ACIREO_33535 [Streptomyces sp. NPDC102441]|uniref:hypothetical protein n=1 Tax=Streptomyces sp. NPDC102441 TaxID=3366176 RepID=UPI0038214644
MTALSSGFEETYEDGGRPAPLAVVVGPIAAPGYPDETSSLPKVGSVAPAPTDDAPRPEPEEYDGTTGAETAVRGGVST